MTVSEHFPAVAFPFAAVMTSLLLTACGQEDIWHSDRPPPDTFEVVSERYSFGEPRRISQYVGQDSATADLRLRATYSPSGTLLKSYNFFTDEVRYFQDLHPQFDSSKGLQKYLQGMWVREEPVRELKRFADGSFQGVQVRFTAQLSRTFRRDTLIMTRFATVYPPRQTPLHDIAEVAFNVDYDPPNKVILQSVIYRRRPDSTQIFSETPVLPAAARGRVVDTLRIYGPKRFRVLTAISQSQESRYEFYSPLRRLPSSLPDELRQLQNQSN